ETLRRAALRWTTPFDAPRINSGSAALSARSAAALSPDASASSAFRVMLRIRLLRAWLTAVRFAFWRTRFLAESILGMRPWFPVEGGVLSPRSAGWSTLLPVQRFLNAGLRFSAKAA